MGHLFLASSLQTVLEHDPNGKYLVSWIVSGIIWLALHHILNYRKMKRTTIGGAESYSSYSQYLASGGLEMFLKLVKNLAAILFFGSSAVLITSAG